MRVSKVEIRPRLRLAIPFTATVVEIGVTVWVSTQLGFKFHSAKWSNQHGKGAELRVRVPLGGFDIHVILDYYPIKDEPHYAETKKTNS